jgi:hypothetical protein
MMRSFLLLLLLVTILYSPQPLVAGNSQLFLNIPYGAGTAEVAGGDEDKFHVTDGFPPAFVVQSNQETYILDAGNARVLYYKPGLAITTLFTYHNGFGTPPAMRDIAVTDDKRICLYNVTEQTIEFYSTKGEKLDYIEGMIAHSIAIRDGALFIRREGEEQILKFNFKGELLGHVSGTGLSAQGPDANHLYHAEIGTKEVVVSSVGFKDAAKELFRIPLAEKEEYICQLTPAGHDKSGNHYLECQFGHDTDKKREKHAYSLFLYRFDGKTNKLTGNMEVPVFRGLPSLVAPRQFVISPEGDFYTYEIKDKYYQIVKHSLENK